MLNHRQPATESPTQPTASATGRGEPVPGRRREFYKRKYNRKVKIRESECETVKSR